MTQQARESVVIIGMGQLGGLLAHGLMRLGYSIYPVLRGDDLATAQEDCPNTKLVLVSVGEDVLDEVLQSIPDAWRDKLVLIQNELLPDRWLSHRISDPTIAVIWFERKNFSAPKALYPTALIGPYADIIDRAINVFSLPTNSGLNSSEAIHAMVLKNLFIITTNVCGLLHNLSCGELIEEHQPWFEAVAREVLTIERARLGDLHVTLDEKRLFTELEFIMRVDPTHGTRGRSAPQRLKRTLSFAEKHQISTPELNNCSKGLEG